MAIRKTRVVLTASILLGVLVAGCSDTGGLWQQRAEPKVIRDIMWAWGNPEMTVEYASSCPKGFQGEHNLATFAQASPLQRAQLLDVPNIIMAGLGLPDTDEEADQLTKEVKGMDRIVWEIMADGRKVKAPYSYTKRTAQLRKLVDKYPNIEGIILDDMSTLGITHGFKPEHIRDIRSQLSGKYSKVEVGGVLYTMSFDRPGMNAYIDELDVISLWTWHARDLVNMEKNVAHCENNWPDKPIILGLYLYDYGQGRKMPRDLLEMQFETALKLAHAGRIEGIVLLTIKNDPETVKRTIEWVKCVGNQKLKTR